MQLISKHPLSNDIKIELNKQEYIIPLRDFVKYYLNMTDVQIIRDIKLKELGI